MSRNPFDAARDDLYKKLSRGGLGEAQMQVALCFLNNASRMKHYGGKGLLSYPGQKRLVEETGLDRGNIRQIIKRLVALGFMHLERIHKPSRISDRYLINEDWQPRARGFRTEKARAAKAAKRAAQRATRTGVKTDPSATGVKTEVKTPTGVKTDAHRGENRPSTGVNTDPKNGLFSPVPSVLPTDLSADAPAERPLPPPPLEASRVAPTPLRKGGKAKRKKQTHAQQSADPRFRRLCLNLHVDPRRVIPIFREQMLGALSEGIRLDYLEVGIQLQREVAGTIEEKVVRAIEFARAKQASRRKPKREKTAEYREHEARHRTDRLLAMVERHWRPSYQDEIEQIRQAFRDGINGGALKRAIRETPLPLDLPATIERARARQARYRQSRPEGPAAGEAIH
jgi:hypothetical protein